MKDGFDRVRKLGLGLPGAEESTSYGAPSLKLRGRMFACMASHSSAEPDTLVALIGFDARDELIAADPEVYYLKPHYVGHPSVLIRLLKVRDDALRDLLLMAWQFVGAQRNRSTAHARSKRRGGPVLRKRAPRKHR